MSRTRRDKKINLDKYSNESVKQQLIYDFNIVSDWMPAQSDSAKFLAHQLVSSTMPRRSIAESKQAVEHLNNVIIYCNNVLNAPEGHHARNNSRLRTAIRRIQDLTASVTDPLNCQSSILIRTFDR